MRTRTTVAALLLAGVLAAQPVARAGGDGERLPAKLQARVDTAIERGVLWLIDEAAGKDGRFGHLSGETALALYTLRSCGAPKEHEVVQQALAAMRRALGTNAQRNTYSCALGLLALERHHAPEGEPGADPHRRRASPGDGDVPRKDRELARELARWLMHAQTPAGGFGYTAPAGAWGDNSNAQFALLGLEAARRLDVEVPEAVWRKALLYFLAQQQSRGAKVDRHEPSGVDEEGYASGGSRVTGKDRTRGFGYSGPGNPTGSMTAAGVSSLAICRGALRGTAAYDDSDLDARVVTAIRDGAAWLGSKFTVEGNPIGESRSPQPTWHYYYLYGLERAGILAGIPLFGRHDWYREGAEYLVEKQSEEGAWGRATMTIEGGGGGRGRPGRGGRGGRPDARRVVAAGNLHDTCFALLFLKRATFRVPGGAVATQADDEVLNLDGAADLDDAAWNTVFDAVFGRYLRTPDALRAARAKDFVVIGTRSIPRLVLALEDADLPSRKAAGDALAHSTGTARGWSATADDDLRAHAVALWEEWWVLHRGRITADMQTGRFVAGE